MRLSLRILSVSAALGLSGAALASQAGGATPAAVHAPLSGIPMAALWREQRIDFVYLGRTSRYSCDGLRDKVRAMMLDLGARRDLKIAAIGCDDTGRQHANSLTPSLNITFSAPALPDRSLKPVRDGDLSATDARFESFTLTSDAFRNMSIGDCELVEAFARQILPKFVTRELKRDIACVPYQLSGSHFLVKGEILRPLPRAEQAPGLQQATVH
jgi:hypothetical protein